jgi:hypothetical protein
MAQWWCISGSSLLKTGQDCRLTKDKILELPGGEESPQAEALEVVSGEPLEEVLGLAVVPGQQVHAGILKFDFLVMKGTLTCDLRNLLPIIITQFESPDYHGRKYM